jgi:transcriptional regulator with XRE-family HTH domain
MTASFDLCGALRRIRRIADMSQRQLAEAAGLRASTVGHAEAGTRDLAVNALVAAAQVAELRLALLDTRGNEVPGMDGDAVRDRAGRRFPAHLDTRYGDEDWWHGRHRYDRTQPWYTFDRDREIRDSYRRRTGTPDDHQQPQPGDAPHERAEARRRRLRRQADEECAQRLAVALERRRTAGLPFFDDGWTCACPPACDELDDRSGAPVHAPGCPCRCDLS